MKRYLAALLLWGSALSLLIWVISSISLHEAVATLQGLDSMQLALLALANTAVIFLLPGRWWLLLKAQGYRLPYLALTRYRLAAFGLSYFTPGPQFGGEPLQLLLVERNYGVSRPAALAAVSLDKGLELLVNFAFLSLGVLIVVEQGIFPGRTGNHLLLASLLLLSLPLLFLGLLWQGYHPLSRLLVFARQLPLLRVAGRHLLTRQVEATVQSAEAEAATLCRRVPHALLPALLASLIAWLALISEFWLMLALLGVPLTLIQLAVLLTATRLGLLLPLPGGLGTLEAALVLGLQSQGLPPAAGFSAALLIRSRDTLLAAAGLWSSGLLRRRQLTT